MGTRGPKKGEGGRKPIVLTEEQIKLAASLAGIGASMQHIAHCIDISPSTLDRLVRKDQRISDALEKGRSQASSKVLKTAYDMATSGKHPWMTSFWLKCKLRWKEPQTEEATKDDVEFVMNYKK